MPDICCFSIFYSYQITEFVKGITIVLPNYGTYTVQDDFITSKKDLLH